MTIAAKGPGGESGAGSGEVIKSDGYILTNNHVIASAASGGSVEVLFSDGATLSGTVTSGIVSAVDRTVQVPGENNGSALLVSALQTDAAINPGNSGRALINCDGQLVGVPTAGASVPSSSGENIGLGFAVPAAVARTISNEIVATGRATHAYFGLQSTPISAESATQAGVPQGLFVAGSRPARPRPRACGKVT
ncbi:MAG: trypsin-like peptidase domain-containing protein [Streptosporangiaceae bacterium]